MIKSYNLCIKILTMQIMKTQELTAVETIKQNIQLVKGEFTPSEAFDVINALIDEKINFHKIQRLQIWERNHVSKTDHLDDRITELQQEKERTRDFILKAKSNGNNLKINGVLEITTAD